MTNIPESLASALLDRYPIERPLGAGGMASVYLAYDRKHDRPVALKVLRPDLAQLLGAERFLREIHLSARLQHPNILAVHDSGETAGQLWFTMPYVAGFQRLVPPVKIAIGYIALGDLTTAFQWLNRGVDEKDIYIPENFFDPLLDPIRRDPRYPALLARMGLSASH